jgi:tRNA 2-thiouridine synthesizing protein A
MRADDTLDLTGLKCPLPALLVKRTLFHSEQGRIVAVVADDPLAHIDLPHMCRQENIDILHSERDGNVVRLWLRRP